MPADFASFAAVLRNLGVAGQVRELPEPAPTAATAAAQLGCEVGAIANSLIFDADENSDLVPVAKRSVGKPGRGGRKWAVRHLDTNGTALSERISLSPPDPGPRDRELLMPLVTAGEIVGREDITVARDRHRAALAELPPYALQLSRGYPAIPTVFDPNGDET